MKLRRLNIDFLGVYISVNMDINTLLAAINLGLGNRPELQLVLGAYISVLQNLQQVNVEISNLLNLLITAKQNLKQAKRVLEIANKVLSAQFTLSIGEIDVKPVVNNTPIATGATAVLSPLKVALETATTSLQQLEDEIDEMQEQLIELTNEYREQLDEAVNNFIEKIADLGGKNLET